MIHLLFDLDDTIFDFKMAEKIALKKTLSSYQIEPTDETVALYSVLNQALWERLEKGEVTRDQVKIGRFQQLFDRLGVKVDPKEVTLTYQENLSVGHYYMEGAKELVYALKDRYRLSLVSNGTSFVQRGRLKNASVTPFFSHIFLSEELGAEKPSPLFFKRAFEELEEFSKENTMIIGDSLSSDILGGKNAGIKTCWFNPHGKEEKIVHPDYTITRLEELFTILNNCFPESK